MSRKLEVASSLQIGDVRTVRPVDRETQGGVFVIKVLAVLGFHRVHRTLSHIGNHQRIKKKINIAHNSIIFFPLRWGSLSRLSGQVSLSETDKRQNFQKSKLKRLFAKMAQIRRMTNI